MSNTATMPPFHLAFPVRDLDEARAFYGDVLGCATGRTSDTWIDFNFWGHQVVAHLAHGDAPQSTTDKATTDKATTNKATTNKATTNKAMTNQVDGKAVPAPHFGVVLGWDEWHALRDKLVAAGFDFVVEPYIRFQGMAGEQATLFIQDPSGNALEFKSFKDIGQLFATD